MASKPTIPNGSRIIQSTFGNGVQKNFETVVLEKDGSKHELVHYWRDNGDPKRRWRRGDTISKRATSAASLIQTGDSDLELLVLEENRVVHYRRDSKGWHEVETLEGGKATGAPSFIQSTYVGKERAVVEGEEEEEGPPGNYEATILEGSKLIHYTRDNSQKKPRWERKDTISQNASGPGSILQRIHYANEDQPEDNEGDLEVVVPEGRKLRRYFRKRPDSGNPKWQQGEEITSSVDGNGPGSFLQSTFTGKRGADGNFELVVYARENTEAASATLSHWWRDNSKPNQPWNKSHVISKNAAGPGSIIQSTYGDAGYPGDLEVVVVERPNNLVHYWRVGSDQWQQGEVISKRAVE